MVGIAVLGLPMGEMPCPLGFFLEFLLFLYSSTGPPQPRPQKVFSANSHDIKPHSEFLGNPSCCSQM